jgi:glycosyltransferase involved in cell wall biosynthesis
MQISTVAHTPFSLPESAGGRLKVCLGTLAPFVGGAEVAAERSALGLLQTGHEVFMLLGQRGPVGQRFEKAGLRCLYAPMSFTDRWRFWSYWRDQRRLRNLLQEEQPHVVHSNDLPTHQVLSAAARGLAFTRLCHHRQVFNGPSIDWFNKYGAEHHVFVSRALMQELCAGSKQLRESSRSVLYDGLELPPPPTSIERKQARSRLGLDLERLLVLFAGQIIVRKGVADLLEAWAKLDPSVRAKAELLIVGDDLENKGAYRAAMEKKAAELGIGPRFCGFQKDVSDWLLAADIAAVPSHVEPLGNATLEAMAYALPVIGGDVGGIPEMIEHGVTGLLVPPHSPDKLADALSLLLTNNALRAQQGAAGRARCEAKFSLTAHAEALLREYATALAVRSGIIPA